MSQESEEYDPTSTAGVPEHGVVGVTVEHSHREIERDRGGGTNYTDLVIEMHVLGTAVVEVERDEPPPDTYLDLQLNDPRETT